MGKDKYKATLIKIKWKIFPAENTAMDMPKTKSRTKKSKNMAATLDCSSQELLGPFEKAPMGKKDIINQRNNETKVKALPLIFFLKFSRCPNCAYQVLAPIGPRLVRSIKCCTHSHVVVGLRLFLIWSYVQVGPRRMEQIDAPSSKHNVEDSFLRGLDAERVLVKNMRKKVTKTQTKAKTKIQTRKDKDKDVACLI